MPGIKRTGEEELWAAGLSILRKLADRGFAAYLVGGCVRDRALGRPIHDVDIATSALPDEVARVFERTIPTGLRHGTVTVLHEGFSFEITTFRTESGYSDARRPDAVTFVHRIEEDLARRDFTFNAMAIGLDGEYVDPFGGRADLQKRVVRCVGEADVRFGEDALRMLRAIRFAAAFGFRLALSTWRGIRRKAARLRHVAMERVGSEWDKMMAGPDPDRACGLLRRSGLPACFKEPLPASVNAGTAVKDARTKGRPLRDIGDPDVRWAAWLIRTEASAEDAETFCRTLRFSAARQTRIRAAVAFDRRLSDKPGDRTAFKTAVLDFGRQAALDWLGSKTKPDPYQGWLQEMNVYTLGQLAVKGDEIARALGKPPGPWLAPLLRRLLTDAAFGRTANTREALMRAAADNDGQTAD